jgi:hypothetical protein
LGLAVMRMMMRRKRMMMSELSDRTLHWLGEVGVGRS